MVRNRSRSKLGRKTPLTQTFFDEIIFFFSLNRQRNILAVLQLFSQNDMIPMVILLRKADSESYTGNIIF